MRATRSFLWWNRRGGLRPPEPSSVDHRDSGGRRPPLLFLIVFLSALAVTLPELARLTRLAVSMIRQPYSVRRARIMDFYGSLHRAMRGIPENEPVAIVMATPGELDRAVFVASYLYPRPARLVHPDNYRNDFSPQRPKTIVRVDSRRPEMVRRVTYAEWRREDIGDVHIVRNAQPTSPPLRTFVVPLVAARDGASPHRYTTEAVLVADAGATVRFTLHPQNVSRTWTLKARVPLAFNDLVDRSFDVMGTGWLQVEATAPIRASFWFVNHGLGRAAPLPLYESPPPSPQRVEGGERLWILNDGDANRVTVNGEVVMLAPHALWSGAASPINEIAGEHVLAFTTRKLPDGNTEFRFP